MMLLYICPHCGHWQDQSLATALGQAMAAFSQAWTGKPSQETPTTVECPGGHGAMTLIQPTDRLALRVDVETTLTDPATGIAITIQADTPKSWRRAVIEAFPEKNEDEPK